MRARISLVGGAVLLLAGVSTSGCLVLLADSPSNPAKVKPPPALTATFDETLDRGLRALAGELPAALNTHQVRTIALLDIVAANGRITALERLVLDRTTQALAKLGTYRVVERQHINKVREEIKLNLSDVIDQSAAVEAGRMMGADALVTGTSFERDDEVDVMLRVIASRTGQVISSAPLRLTKDRNALRLLGQLVTWEARASRPPLQLSMLLAARRARDERLVREHDVLHSGDRFQVYVQTNAECYFYVILVEQRGQVQLLSPEEGKPAGKLKAGTWHRLPSADRWWLLDNRPGVETVYVLAAYEPLDLKTLLAQLVEGAMGKEVKISGRGREAEVAQEITLQQRSARLGQPGGTAPAAVTPVLVPGASLRVRGVEKTVAGTAAAVALPESEQQAAITETVQGYTTAVSSITYVHQ